MTQTLTTETLKNLSYSGGIVGDLARELLANREAQPVACDIERIKRHALPAGECPKQSQVVLLSSLLRLFTAPPVPAVMDKPRLPPHVYRDLLDMLQEAAIAYGGTQQLRAQLSSALSIHVQPDHPHTRSAMLAQPVSQGYRLDNGIHTSDDRTMKLPAEPEGGNEK